MTGLQEESCGVEGDDVDAGELLGEHYGCGGEGCKADAGDGEEVG